MIVDDELNVLEEVKKNLESEEIQVIAVDNNKEALELLSNQNEDDYGLVLIDTSLPDSDKPALFSMKPGSKMNIDTTKEEDFLTKPFTKDQLIDFVKKKI